MGQALGIVGRRLDGQLNQASEARWYLGRVQQTFPDQEGLVASLYNQATFWKWPLTLLDALPGLFLQNGSPEPGKVVSVVVPNSVVELF